MSFLSALRDPILPIFAILAFGYVIGRAGKFDLAAARTLNWFAMTVLVPIAVFNLLAHAPLSELSGRALLIYSGMQAALFALGYQLSRRLFGIGRAEAVLLAYAGIFANTFFYTLPISRLLFGPDQILPVTTVVVLDSTVSFAGVMIVLQVLNQGSASPMSILRIFARTPALLAIFAGMMLAMVGIGLPGAVETFLDFNGVAAAPVALFALGVILSGTRFTLDGAVASVVAIKLLALPAVVAWGLWLGGVPETDARVFTFAAAGPAGAMALSLSVLHGVPSDRVAQVLVWTSLLTLLTLAALA